MRPGSARARRLVTASITALATLVTYAGISAPTAQAAPPPDQDVAAFSDFLARFSAVLPGAAGVGPLGQALPTLDISPAGPGGIGLATLFAESLAATDLSTATDLGSLAGKISGTHSISSGRDIAWTASTSSAAGIESLVLSLHATRTAKARLDLQDPAGKLSLVSDDAVNVALTGDLGLTLRYDTTSHKVWMVGSSPSLTVGFTSSLAAGTIKAGLGILGVEVTSGGFDLHGQVGTTWSDPNNDGRLAFDETGTNDGELAASGAGAGLLTAHIAGSLDATLGVQATQTPLLPISASASVHVAQAALGGGPPVVTATLSDAIKPFLTLSTRDLAQGLAQASAAVLAMQDATGAKLPFMRGDLSSAVGATEAIAAFLKKYVPEPTPGTSTPGLPGFTSLQDLLDKLDSETGLPGGATIDIAAASYDAPGKKVAFTLNVARAASASPAPLNVTGDPTTGAGSDVTYGDKRLTDLSKDFSTFGASLSGRQIAAGTGAAVIKGVKPGDVHTLDLDPAPLDPDGAAGPLSAPDVLWQGGTPAAGTPYSIAANDPKIGLVELGNALKGKGGILNANAKAAVATVKPSYDLSLPLVLDLRDPDTTDCNPDPGTASPCPFSQTENGITRIISELPLSADRIMLGTGTSGSVTLLTADAPISTDVDVDATVGFVGVQIKGTLSECTTNAAHDCSGATASGKHLLEIRLASLVGNGADAAGDIPITKFFDKLRTAVQDGHPENLFDFQVNGQAYADLTVSVPGAPQYFGAANASASAFMGDLTDPGSIDVTGPELDRLLAIDVDPDNPLALFGALLSTLQSLQGAVGTIPGVAGLDAKIPLVGRSFSELAAAGVSGGGTGVSYAAGPAGSDSTILTDTSKTFTKAFVGRRAVVGSVTSVVVDAADHTLQLKPALPTAPGPGSPYALDSELQGVINLLQQKPTSTLQEMLDLLETQLGDNSGADFSVDPPASAGDPAVLRLNLDWKRDYSTQAPLNFDFGDHSLVAAKGSGNLDISATGEVKLTMRLPLTAAAVTAPATHLTIDPAGSFIDAGVNINGDGVRLTANLGPFRAALGDPNVANDAGTKLHAGLGVKLSNTGSAPVTLSDFFGTDLHVAVNGGGAACGTDVPVDAGTSLALCAKFPAYLNGDPVNANPDQNNFVVRLPVGGDLLNTFSLTGTAGGHARLETPTGLDAALSAAALNLLSFGDGLFGYLDFLEGSLRTASFDGKLPVIGKDLQAGSDFVGNLRTDLHTAFEASGVPTNPTAGDIRTFLNTKLDAALPSSNPMTIELTCTTTLHPAAAPTATAAGGGAGTHYTYEVVAYTNTGKDETTPSPASAPVENAATLDGTHKNTVSWASVPNATGYLVLRSTDGAAFQKLKDVGADPAPAYTDTGADAGTAYTAATEEPTVVPCPASASPLDVDGFTVSVDIGQGNPTAATGCDDADCLAAKLPLDLGIPGLSIKATDQTDGVEGKVGWKLHLKVGFSREDGFYVATQDTKSPEFRVGASLNVPDTTAQLAFIQIHETSNSPAPEFRGQVAIDLRDAPGAATDCTQDACTIDPDRKLTLDKLTSGSIGDFVHPVLDAAVDIDWHLAATADSALPGISTDFLLGWSWTTDAPGDFGNLSIAFNNVSLEAGDFLGKAIKPVVQQVVDVFKPVQPIIDTIYAPIPVLSDLSKAVGGDDITIATLAQTFSTIAGGPDLQPFLDVLANIRTLLKNLSASCPGGNPCLKVGDFKLLSPKAVSTDANPGTAAALIDPDPATQHVEPNLLGRVDDKTTGDLAHSGSDPDHSGFTFPVLEDPTKIFGLIVGQDVELVRFDSGPLTLGFEFQESFGPIYAPPPVNVVIGGGASVSLRIVAGFDTYGIRTAIESGKVNAGILDSLYFVTTDKDGKPIPVVQFEGFLEAGASVSAVIIEVGIVGGIKLTVGFFWNDPNNDGKFRFGEFLATALSNPICLFNVGGELSLFIKVFVTLGISPFSVSFDFTLVSIKLLDFSLQPDCTPPPPRLGGTEAGVLYLFAGKLGTAHERGNAAWDSKNTADEAWIVRQLPADPATGEPAKLVVQALGITEEFPSSGIDTVVLDGRGYAGKLQVMFSGGTANAPFTKKSVVMTGSGEDTVRTGQGESWVDAGGAHDEVTTLDRPVLSVPVADSAKARVAGGGGPDAITVGNAKDVVMGDGSLDVSNHSLTVKAANNDDVSLTDVLDPGTVQLPANPAATGGDDGGDQISAGLGGSTLYGNNGDDKIGTANDNPQAALPSIKGTANEALYRAQSTTVVGGGGSDRIKSGSAADVISTGDEGPIDGDSNGSGDASGDKNAVDTGEGNDTVYGSNASDFVITHSTASQHATAFGGDSEDVLVGGLGTDKLYGGPGDDYLVAQPATVSDDKPLTDVLGNARRVTLDAPDGVTAAKTLVGGGGHDRIYGADGPATIFGDHEVDGCVAQHDPVSQQPPQHPSGDDASDLILGGDGVDTVQAGGGDDHVYAYGNDDVLCGNAGADEMYGGGGADLAYGGTGGDQLFGEAGADQVYGNDGDDALYGGTEDDRIQGNDGTDRGFGGAGADLVIGGTSKAAQPDEGDLLYGDEGNDVVIGDNADADTIPAYPADLANTDASPSIGGKDTVFGGDGNDLAYGGLADDDVFGGAANDDLEGNNATDRVYGEDGSDDIIGGSSQVASTAGRPDAGDELSGGAGDDVIAGDNAVLVRTSIGSIGSSPITRGRAGVGERAITLLDLGHGGAPGLFGDDAISGGDANDVILGERGQDTIHADAGDDYAEGGQAGDTIFGDTGEDDLLGGSFVTDTPTTGQLDSGDTIRGGDGGDVVLGDNGLVTRVAPFTAITQGRGPAARSVTPYDLGDAPGDGSLTSGNDYVEGNAGQDVVLGEGGNDRVLAGADSDYAEGGQAQDWLEGGAGSDDLVGGSSAVNGPGSGDAAKGQPDGADVIWGQAGDDLVAGDNAVLTRVAPYDPLTDRVGTGTAKIEPRSIRLLDRSNGGLLTAPDAIRFGADQVSGQAGVDLLLGQDGSDRMSGGGDDDYAEGQGGADLIYGDAALDPAPAEPAGLLGAAGSDYALDTAPEGQDDLLGGSSTRAFRDQADEIHGNGSSDFVLGDNGTVKRDIQAAAGGSFTDRIYTKRYGPGAVDRAKVRIAGTGTSTRFCATGNGSLCEPAQAAGSDQVFGDGGDDFLYGQDGDDTIHGNAGDDDVYGELGNDVLFGEAGNDAVLGDRGGIRDVYETGSRSVAVSQNPPPRISYLSRQAGSVSREVDLLHEVNGDEFSAGSTAAAILFPGTTSGGDDRIRGGTGRDNLHGGTGDDLVNGDSGGDTVFGDDGADVLWGGKGCWAGSPDDGADCTDPSARGTNDRYVDYLFGGKGATTGPSVAGNGLGADVIDWRPRGAAGSCATAAWPTTIGNQTNDPCSWFDMTDMKNASVADDQHHQGIDWQYGGWDRDVLQGDVADNGPNDGDRLLDWDGAYNLYSHCNPAYGGFNDVRQHSPAMQDFLQKWGYGAGLGQVAGDVTTDGSSAFDELALTYNQDGKDHGNGKAFPSTPGHFDDPNACAG